MCIDRSKNCLEFLMPCKDMEKKVNFSGFELRMNLSNIQTCTFL